MNDLTTLSRNSSRDRCAVFCRVRAAPCAIIACNPIAYCPLSIYPPLCRPIRYIMRMSCVDCVRSCAADRCCFMPDITIKQSSRQERLDLPVASCVRYCTRLITRVLRYCVNSLSSCREKPSHPEFYASSNGRHYRCPVCFPR